MLKILVDDKDVTALLTAMVKRAENTKPAFAQIGREFVEEVRLGFQGSHDPYGTPWARLKSRQGQPLLNTGRLRNSFASRLIAGGVEVGTNVAYAAIHQTGGKTAPHVITPKSKRALFWPGARHPAKRVNHPGSVIPARPMLPGSQLPDNWLEVVREVVAAHLLRS